jgi:class 3 adenylate cyclase/tetratricopeptide (TPR) repeat protein
VSSAWRPYVPDEVIRALLETPGKIPVGLATRSDAVVLFGDIAGFTPMSEALAKVGRYGDEELSQILNDYFGCMVEQAVAYGGSVVRLTGDALTALFPYDHSSRALVARRSVQCALDMQAAMAAFQALDTEAGVFRLAMRAGLAMGPVLGMIVGEPTVRLEYVIAGRTIDRAAAAEQRAATGQVVVDRGLLEADGGLDAVELGGGAHLVRRVERPVDTVPARPPDAVGDAITSRLAPFLHPAIAERLRTGRRGLVNEHRQVTVAFVGFPDLPEDAAEGATSPQTYLTAAVRVIDRYGGHLNQVDTGDKGSLLMLMFGAPVAHEDDEERAVHCCLELLRLPGGPFRVGITTGLVFCGEIGSNLRRYYTVVGDSVNLAARLLQAAQPGQLLIDGPTFQRVEAGAVGERLQPIIVKGKAGPVNAWAVRAARERPGLQLLEPQPSGRLVGRDAEIGTIHAVARRALAGRGQVLSLSGDAGIGKSRLVAEAVAVGERLGFAIHGGACRSYGTTTGYVVWRPIVRGLLAVDPALPSEEQRAQIDNRMGAYGPDWAVRAPLLAPVLGLPMPDSNLTRSLDPRTRAELLRSLLLDLVRRRAATGPLLLALEDCHWIDAPSAALLAFLARNAADLPVLMIVAARYEAAGPMAVAQLASLTHCTELQLRDLPTAATERLAAERLRASYGKELEVPAEVVRNIAERSGGNPFHVEELVAFLHARGVDLRDPRQFVGLQLPGSLHTLVLARLDQLSEGEQATVKVASVIGRVFRARWLWGSYSQVGSPEDVARHLKHLDALGITPLHSTVPEAEYGFKHAIIQEVAYDSLTFGMRQTLHEAVGAFIERTYAGRLDQYVDVLAYHYGRTRNEDKQRVWFRAAGDAAKAGYANEAAVEHFERLLPLLAADQTGDVLLELGAVWHLVGRWTGAEQAYRRAMEVAEGRVDRPLLAASKRELGILLMRTRSYPEGLTWLTEAAGELERLGDLGGLATALDRLAFAAIQQGAYADADAAANRHLAIATRAEDRREASGALHNLGLIAWDTGRRDAALTLLRNALTAAAEAGDERGRGRIASDLATLHAEGGHHGDAVDYVRQALSIAQRIGDLWVVAVCIANAAELHLDRGEYALAARSCAHGLSVALELRDWVLITQGVGRFAAIAAAIGEQERAEKLYARAVALARSSGDSIALYAYLHQQAKLLAAAGRLEEAERTNQEILEATASADARTRLRAELLSIRLRVALGRLNPGAALARLEEMVAAAAEAGEQAAIWDAIWQVDPTREDARERAADLYRAHYEQAQTVECREAYERLTGIELPPGQPLPSPLEPLADGRAELDADALLRKVDEAARELEGTASSPNRPSDQAAGQDARVGSVDS